MMLLSRSAWQLFWIGRLLERAEGTAQAVWSMHMMDSSPRARALSTWSRLLEAFGQTESFTQSGGDTEDHRAVMRFMTVSRDNPNSMHGLVGAMRHNMRSARGFLPDELWRYSTELGALAEGVLGEASKRYDVLDRFIQLCRASAGVTMTAMRRDAAYGFWQIGRRLECAEITSRILLWALSEAREDEDGDDDSVTPQDNLRWVFVLKSMGLAGAYHAGTHAAVTGAGAIDFIVGDDRLPRSARSCLSTVRLQLEQLPANEQALKALARASQAVARISGFKPDREKRLDRLVEALGRTFDAVAAAYFPQFK